MSFWLLKVEIVRLDAVLNICKAVPYCITQCSSQQRVKLFVLPSVLKMNPPNLIPFEAFWRVSQQGNPPSALPRHPATPFHQGHSPTAQGLQFMVAFMAWLINSGIGYFPTTAAAIKPDRRLGGAGAAPTAVPYTASRCGGVDPRG